MSLHHRVHHRSGRWGRGVLWLVGSTAVSGGWREAERCALAEPVARAQVSETVDAARPLGPRSEAAPGQSPLPAVSSLPRQSPPAAVRPATAPPSVVEGLLDRRALVTARPTVRLWWSFPGDDPSAIEIDDADLRVSRFVDPAALARVATRCRGRSGRSSGTRPMREIRIESLATPPRAEQRCALPLSSWRGALGVELLERLEDELDAHLSFLLPRKVPAQARTPPAPGASQGASTARSAPALRSRASSTPAPTAAPESTSASDPASPATPSPGE
jgi:hypothetical protein